MSLLVSRFPGGRQSSILLAAVTALSVCASACGSRTEDIPYSTLKQHITKGEVREVRLSAIEIQATPTDKAQAAGAPSKWLATPVASDNLVPLLESKGIT